METRPCTLLLSALLIVSAAGAVMAEPAKAYNIRMHRSDMPDITDIPSTIDSIVHAGMTGEQKARAMWRTVFQFTQFLP